MPHQKGYLKRRFVVSGSLLTALKTIMLATFTTYSMV